MTEKPSDPPSSVDTFIRGVAQLPAVPVHDPVGETVGRYRILSLLGKGGMGRVYEAEDLELGRFVAIKFLPAAFAQHADTRARFARERLVTADLEHPAIVPVYDSGVWSSGEPFYVMRQVRGDPLDRRLATAETLEERLVFLGNVIAMADAVAFAHSRAIVHRDLKPANVLVGRFGETYVADWGLAKHVADEDVLSASGVLVGDGEAEGTRAGAVLGTPAYMAPEQSEGRGVGPRADVYALGAILHELLVGRPPEAARGATDAVATGSRARLGTLPSTLGDLVAIVEKSIAVDPAHRYPSASDVATELRRFQAGQLVGARRYTRAELATRWLARHRAAAAVAAAMGALLVLVVLVGVARVVRERDAARAGRLAADAARREATERNEALMFLQARTELTHDPTASLAWLKRYPRTAGNWREASRIAADAVARGVSLRVWNVGTPLGSVAYAPNGASLAVGGGDGTLVFLDAATGAERRLHADGGVGARAVFSPDGAWLATSDGNDSVLLWDVALGTSKRLPGDHVGGAHVAFSHDGSIVLARHTGGFDRLWRVPSGEPIDVPRPGALFALAPRADVVFAAGAERLEQLELGSWRVLASTPLEGPAADLEVSGDGRWVAASRTDALVLWSPGSGIVHRVPVGKPAVRLLAPSPDGRSFMSCGSVTDAWLFDVASATARLFSTDERCTRQAFSFSPDGTLFVSTGFGGALTVHDGGNVRKLLGHDVAVTDATFAPDGAYLASVSSDGTARLWSLDRGDVRVERGAKPLERIAAGGRLLVSTGNGTVTLVDLNSGVRTPLSGPRPPTRSGGSISADGRVVAYPDADGKLIVVDLASQQRRNLGFYDGPMARETAEVLSADGSLLAEGDERGAVHVIDLSTGRQRTVGDLGDRAFAIALSTDARLVAAGGRSGIFGAWDVSTGEARLTVPVQGLIWDVVVSPEGSRVAAAANDGMVYVADLVHGGVRRLSGHIGTALSVDFLPDGRRLLSSGADGTVRLWDLDHEGSVTVRRDSRPVFWVRSSVDGSRVASTSAEEAWVWKTASLPPGPDDLTAFLGWVDTQTHAEVDPVTTRVH